MSDELLRKFLGVRERANGDGSKWLEIWNEYAELERRTRWIKSLDFRVRTLENEIAELKRR